MVHYCPTWISAFFINESISCGVALNLQAYRADNLDAWIDCNFENNTVAVGLLRDQNSPFFINSQFINNAGDPIINTYGGGIFFVNCYFGLGTLGTSFFARNVIVEGSTFDLGGLSSLVNPNASLVSRSTASTNTNINIYNSQSSGIPLGPVVGGIFLNSQFSNDPSINQQGTLFSNSTNFTILPGVPNPSPQFLVYTLSFDLPTTTSSVLTTATSTSSNPTSGSTSTSSFVTTATSTTSNSHFSSAICDTSNLFTIFTALISFLLCQEF